MVIRLRRGFFTINNSFREENYDDPENKDRRLSEFTLIEPEKPYEGFTSKQVLDRIVKEETELIKYITQNVIEQCPQDVRRLGGDLDYLKKVIQARFERINYDDALKLLNLNGCKYKFGDDLWIRGEKKILEVFDYIPTFITYYPADIKFFNMKRTKDGERVYSVDLLTPKLGETIGGAVREENGNIIKEQLLNSKITKYIREKGLSPIDSFSEYLDLFEQEKQLLRGVME